MASLFVRAQVKDFQAWKKVYDEAADLRSSFGGGADRIYRDESDPNTYTAIIEWDSIENAKRYSQSPELKTAMERAGVLGPPTVHYLNEA